MDNQGIEKITHQDDYLTVYYKKPWFQEDIAGLTENIFSNLQSIHIQEKVLGADRENIRFSWQEHYFILNFDCCSQSCWLEGQDEKSATSLKSLYSALM